MTTLENTDQQQQKTDVISTMYTDINGLTTVISLLDARVCENESFMKSAFRTISEEIRIMAETIKSLQENLQPRTYDHSAIAAPVAQHKKISTNLYTVPVTRNNATNNNRRNSSVTRRAIKR